jgi:protocatechuate 3,4-dioxygenase beta subunit
MKSRRQTVKKLRANGVTAVIKLEPTPRQVKGPFFIVGALKRSNFVPAGETENIYRIRGQVLGTDGKPVANAKVYVWLADKNGKYPNQDADGNPVPMKPEESGLHGYVETDENGFFEFTFQRPGNYPLTGEEVDIRPAHVHILIEKEGYSELITQVYFIDDPYNVHDIPRQGFFKPELILPCTPALPDGKSVQEGIFNFVIPKLKPLRTGKGLEYSRTLMPNDPVKRGFFLASANTDDLLTARTKCFVYACKDAYYKGIGIDRFVQMVNETFSADRYFDCQTTISISILSQQIEIKNRADGMRVCKHKAIIKVNHDPRDKVSDRQFALSIRPFTISFTTLEF